MGILEYEDLEELENTLMKRCIDELTIDSQYEKLIGECLELSLAVLGGVKEPILEELTDVYLMVKEFMIYFNQFPNTKLSLRKWRRIKLNKVNSKLELVKYREEI